MAAGYLVLFSRKRVMVKTNYTENNADRQRTDSLDGQVGLDGMGGNLLKRLAEDHLYALAH